MQVTLKVRRFDPDVESPEARFQEYVLEMEDTATVLDGLIKVREEVDGTLTLRCSCRSAICGSCAMRINGQAGLACNTKMSDAMPRDGGPVTVEPAGNMRVIKDLVTDFQPFWDKVRAVEPWLQPEGPEPEAEYIAPNEAMLHEAGVMACIMCGACVSDCTVLEVDSNFLGPAALAKAYRLVVDPRDDAGAVAPGRVERVRGRLGLHAVHAVRRGVPRRASRRWTGSWPSGNKTIEAGPPRHVRRSARRRLHRFGEALRLARRASASHQDLWDIQHPQDGRADSTGASRPAGGQEAADIPQEPPGSSRACGRIFDRLESRR